MGGCPSELMAYSCERVDLAGAKMDQHDNGVTSADSGVLYVLSNEHIPGLLKVGKTRRTAQERARELRSTGVPGEYKVEWQSKPLRDVGNAEREAHAALDAHREDREFFRIDAEEATLILKRIEVRHLIQPSAGYESTPENALGGLWAAGRRQLALRGRTAQSTWLGAFILPGIVAAYGLRAAEGGTPTTLAVAGWGVLCCWEFVGIVRRLNDHGFPGKWIALGLVVGMAAWWREALAAGGGPWLRWSIGGVLLILVLVLLSPGTSGANRYGPDPRAGRTPGPFDVSLVGMVAAFVALLGAVVGIAQALAKLSDQGSASSRGGFGIANGARRKGSSLSYLRSQRNRRR